MWERDCYDSVLAGKPVGEEEFQQAVDAARSMGWTTFREFHDCYLHTDVLALADVMESYRDSFRSGLGLHDLGAPSRKQRRSQPALHGSSLCCAGQRRRHAEHHGRLLLHGGHGRCHNSSLAGLLHLLTSGHSVGRLPHRGSAGRGDALLGDYRTGAAQDTQTQAAIAGALLAYRTGPDQDVFSTNQITSALVAYRSSADQDTATASSIAAALLSYYTITQVDGLLANKLGVTEAASAPNSRALSGRRRGRRGGGRHRRADPGPHGRLAVKLDGSPQQRLQRGPGHAHRGSERGRLHPDPWNIVRTYNLTPGRELLFACRYRLGTASNFVVYMSEADNVYDPLYGSFVGDQGAWSTAKMYFTVPPNGVAKLHFGAHFQAPGLPNQTAGTVDVYGLQILDATLEAGNTEEEDTAASALLLKHEFLDGGADDVTLATLGKVLLEPTLTTLANFLVRSTQLLGQLRGGRLPAGGAYQDVRASIMGGLSCIFQPYARANNPELGEDNVPAEPSSWISYLDFNAMYPAAMTHPMVKGPCEPVPLPEMRWLHGSCLAGLDWEADDEAECYLLLVDYDFPPEAHDYLDWAPPARMKVGPGMYGPHTAAMAASLGVAPSPCEKLVPFLGMHVCEGVDGKRLKFLRDVLGARVCGPTASAASPSWPASWG